MSQSTPKFDVCAYLETEKEECSVENFAKILAACLELYEKVPIHEYRKYGEGNGYFTGRREPLSEAQALLSTLEDLVKEEVSEKAMWARAEARGGESDKCEDCGIKGEYHMYERLLERNLSGFTREYTSLLGTEWICEECYKKKRTRRQAEEAKAKAHDLD